MPKRKQEKPKQPPPSKPKNRSKKIFIISIAVVLAAWLYQPAQPKKLQLEIEATDTTNMIELESRLPLDPITKNFPKETLVFVTPWNKEGYLYTLDYAAKIDYVSPVWYTVKFDTQLRIDGEQDVDTIYLQQLKQVNPNLKIVPRVYVEFESKEKFMSVNQEKLVRLIIEVANRYDGIVFDSPIISYQQLLGIGVNVFLKRLKQAMPGKVLVASIMGYNPQLRWTSSMTRDLVAAVDRLLVCVYDYNGSVPGQHPLSPKSWVKENVLYFKQHASKILMGIPFYGFKLDKQGQVSHVMAKEYHIFTHHSITTGMTIAWDKDIEECVFEGHIFYPCNQFIKNRLDYYAEHNMGAFVWEGGQGFKQFYELF